jgi:hypothetical protein
LPPQWSKCVRVDVDRHPLAFGEQVGNADRRDADRGGVHGAPTVPVVVDT